jgi:hypothetical protein
MAARKFSRRMPLHGLQLFVALLGGSGRPCNFALTLSPDGHIAPIIVIFVITITAAINHRGNNGFQEG